MLFVFVASLTNLFPKAQRSTNAFKNHSNPNPSIVVIELRQAEAGAKRPEVLDLFAIGSWCFWGACCWGARWCSCGWCCCRAFGFPRYELKKVFGKLGDVFQFVAGARCPDVFAVALDFCRGASTEVILELNVHVIFDVLIGDCCSCCDVLFLGGGCVEEVMFSAEGGFLAGGASGIHLQLVK